MSSVISFCPPPMSCLYCLRVEESTSGFRCSLSVSAVSSFVPG